jgi:hypothetical protein
MGRRPRRRVAGVILGAAALISLGSCRGERTQIVVVVDTDYAVTAAMGGVRIGVASPTGGAAVQQPIELKGATSAGCTDMRSDARFCVPLSLLITPAADRPADAPVEVTVEGVAGSAIASGRVLVKRTARLRFSPGQTLRLPMFLTRLCEGIRCPTDFTCAEGGRCIPIDQPPGVEVIDPRTGAVLDGSTRSLDASTPPLEGGVDLDAEGDVAANPEAGPMEDVRDDARLDATWREAAGDAAVDVAPIGWDGSDASLDATAVASDGSDASLDAAAVASDGSDASLDAAASMMDAATSMMDAAVPLDAGARDAGPEAGDASADGPPGMPCGDAGCAVAGHLIAGENFTCLRTATGAIACWGANEWGQLGRGTITPLVGGVGGEHTPVVIALPMSTVFGVGATHACAVTGVGPMQRVSCWGDNRDRALGVSSVAPAVTAPSPVLSFSPSLSIAQLTLGDRTSFAFAGRDLHAWGANPDQTLGFSTAPAIVTPPRILASALRAGVASARSQGFCWLDNRVSSCVGLSRRGRFGSGVAIDGVLSSPTELAAPYHAEAFALSDTFACRVDRQEVSCWGENLASGALGAIPIPGDPAIVLSPRTVTVPIPFGSDRIEEIAVGADFALVRSTMGRVVCWGSNAEGQCATGTLAPDRRVIPSATAPQSVVFPAGFSAPARGIAAGRSHACALDASGAVWCWGRNSHGQVGEPWSDDPATRRWLQPVRVPLIGR